MTDVVAALIRDGERMLICQRPANKKRALLWEFPGGKVEPGETPQDALIRECEEELGILIQVGCLFTQVEHIYPDIHIRLSLYNANISHGIPELREHHDLRWITAREIDGFEFCPADQDILLLLKQEAKK
ncbi:MAG: (deoxy)nucleoside triphosphate pyrophosphohydrolase [Clostridiales bacterium]|jgi:8-oxo-dGTP diphosphatase|nr:(deoxy)nucleoside triphosphate pyrophosphohydrolase [Clostridiales bacterium]